MFRDYIETRATFIGKNGSMGLIHGAEYYFTLKIESGYIIVDLGLNYCQYETMKELLKNWRF